MNAGPTVRVVLVEDHDMVREAMVAALAVYTDVEVVAAGASLAEGRELIDALDPDVVVTDLRLEDGDGTELVAAAARRPLPPPVLLITGTDDHRGVEEAIGTGCAGFVSKAQGFDRLVDAIRVVAAGGAVFPADLLGATLRPEPDDPERLSERELEVLQLLAEARTVDEIAEALFISPHTVRNHVRQVLTKLGAHSQLEAVVIAARRRLVIIA